MEAIEDRPPKKRVAAPAHAVPFSPEAILFMSLIFTMLAGGILVAINWRRLGRPRYAAPTLLLTLAAFVVFLLVVYGYPWSAASSFGLLTLNLIPAFFLVGWQSKPYHAWVARHRRPTIFQSGIGVYAWTIVLAVPLAMFIAGVFVYGSISTSPGMKADTTPEALRPYELFQKSQTYQGGGITLTYPADWKDSAQQNSEDCTVTGMECLIIAISNSGARLSVVRLYDEEILAVPLDEYDKTLVNGSMMPLPDIELLSSETLDFQQRPGIMHRFTYTKNGQARGGRWMLIRDRDAYFLVTIQFSPVDESAADAIIASLHFTDD